MHLPREFVIQITSVVGTCCRWLSTLHVVSHAYIHIAILSFALAVRMVQDDVTPQFCFGE